MPSEKSKGRSSPRSTKPKAKKEKGAPKESGSKSSKHRDAKAEDSGSWFSRICACSDVALCGKKDQIHKKEKKEKKEKKVKRNSPAKKEEPEHWRPAAEHRSESENSANSAVANPKDADICDELGAKAPALLIPESEVKALQEEINRKIGKFAALPKEESSREMLSEFVVCMAIAGKGGKEIERELAPFLADEAKNFVKWFGKHIQRFKKS
mmetsp:Transcript_103564/g.163515  ORF Transcript_103564/g.163515 Transcript_103564/m.163515 type:complete len:211 (+) Transcript_103564:115-747(+)